MDTMAESVFGYCTPLVSFLNGVYILNILNVTRSCSLPIESVSSSVSSSVGSRIPISAEIV